LFYLIISISFRKNKFHIDDNLYVIIFMFILKYEYNIVIYVLFISYFIICVIYGIYRKILKLIILKIQFEDLERFDKNSF